MANQILPFCDDDTGSNLVAQATYAVTTARTQGNQPGTASSQLNNKALRQCSYVAANFAEILSRLTGVDVVDDANQNRMQAQIAAAITVIPPRKEKQVSPSTGTYLPQYYFFIESGSASFGATYTHNGTTYTVYETVAAGVVLRAIGNAAPLASGTLTKASGTGDATITFWARRAPISLSFEMVGGGGGGGGSGTGAVSGTGVAGGDTTFGSWTAGGGGRGGWGIDTDYTKGTVSALGAAVGVAVPGMAGGRMGQFDASSGIGYAPAGGSSPFGGAGASVALVFVGGGSNINGIDAKAESGSGGGAGIDSGGDRSGSSGGAGGYINATIYGTLTSYAFAVGAGGAGQSAPPSGAAGGAGGSGVLITEERYQ